MIVFVSWLGSKVVGLLRLALRGHWHLFFSQSMKFWVSSGSISSRKKLNFSRRSLRWSKPRSHRLQQAFKVLHLSSVDCDFHRGAIVESNVGTWLAISVNPWSKVDKIIYVFELFSVHIDCCCWAIHMHIQSKKKNHRRQLFKETCVVFLLAQKCYVDLWRKFSINATECNQPLKY